MKLLRIFISSFLVSLSILIPLFLISLSYASAETDNVENSRHCDQCGMDLTGFVRSRMMITYSDGTTVEVCSLHCAVENMKKNKDKQVKSIMVADYTTKELIDAASATWVVGGKKKLAMTPVAKWAFAKEEDARQFARENGGEETTFDQARRAAQEEVSAEADASGRNHMPGCSMGPGSQMLYNPAFGDDIYHVHPAGMWMVNYKFMHVDMRGLRDGTTDVPVSQATPVGNKPYGYMMAPTRMTMDMNMLMIMYGITDRFTVMAMANYQDNTMEMVMNMGMGNMPMPNMHTSGFGDTELRGIYKINEYFIGSLGLSLPTGDINKSFTTMGMTYHDPYDMQLGSGTYDLKPALTYNVLSDDAKWNWGAQAEYTWHTGRNENGWTLGDNLKVTSWLQRALGPATAWVRMAYNDTGRIRGEDPQIQMLLDPVMGVPTPDADPRNYGGQRLDGLLGVSYTKGPVSLGIEGGVPLYQYLNGLQLKTKWILTTGLQVMF